MRVGLAVAAALGLATALVVARLLPASSSEAPSEAAQRAHGLAEQPGSAPSA
jgi:hypothetical protein